MCQHEHAYQRIEPFTFGFACGDKIYYKCYYQKQHQCAFRNHIEYLTIIHNYIGTLGTIIPRIIATSALMRLLTHNGARPRPATHATRPMTATRSSQVASVSVSSCGTATSGEI